VGRARATTSGSASVSRRAPGASSRRPDSATRYGPTRSVSGGARSPPRHRRGRVPGDAPRDSTFWGTGCAEGETLDARLERLAIDRGLVAFNFATPGYNTLQELLVARAFLPDVRPDHVILGLFVGNDPLATWLAAVDAAGNYTVSDARLEAFERELRSRLAPVIWHSSALRVAAAAAWAPRLRYELALRDDVVGRTTEVLDELAALCAAQGVRLSVVVLYPKDAVSGRALAAWTGSRSVGER